MILNSTLNKLASKYEKTAQQTVPVESLPDAPDERARALMQTVHAKLAVVVDLATDLNNAVNMINRVAEQNLQKDDGAALKAFGAAMASLNSALSKLDAAKTRIPEGISSLNVLMTHLRMR